MAFLTRFTYVDVICDESLKNEYANGKATGYRFNIMLSYYRGHYLSDIDQLEVYTDGEKVDDRDLTFGIKGKTFTVSELSRCISEFWTIREPAVISVVKKGGLTDGKHRIKIVMYLRIPYLPLPGTAEGEHRYMPLDNCDEKIMKVAGGVA